MTQIIPDIGILLEIFGFIFLLLVGGRNPTASHRVLEGHKESKFDVFRQKIIPDEFVYKYLIFGIGLVVLGLILQFSFLNPW